MDGFIDPKKNDFFYHIFGNDYSLLSKVVGLIIAFIKSRKAKSSITAQKSLVYSMTAFIIAFFVFVLSQVIIK